MTEHWMDHLYEGDVWVSADGPMRVEDMTAAHAARAYRWALRQAQHVLLREQMSMTFGPQPSSDMACDGFNRALDELYDHADDPEAWLAATPLLRALGVRGGLVAPEPEGDEEESRTMSSTGDTFIHRPQTVKAYRFDFFGMTLEDFRQKLGPFVEVTQHQVPGSDRGLQTILRIRSLHQTVEVALGDWLLVEGERFWTMSDEEFQRDFSALADAEILCYCGSDSSEGDHKLCRPDMKPVS